jgi:hypothetical protein
MKNSFITHRNSILMKPTFTFIIASRNISFAAIQLIPVARQQCLTMKLFLVYIQEHELKVAGNE